MLICRLTLLIGITLSFVGLGRDVPEDAVLDAAVVVPVGDCDGGLGRHCKVPLEMPCREPTSPEPRKISASTQAGAVCPAQSLDA